MAEDLASRGLTQARATVLAQLHRAGPSNQRALADALRVTPRNITGLVDALEDAGLVARIPTTCGPSSSRSPMQAIALQRRSPRMNAHWPDSCSSSTTSAISVR